MSILSLMCYQCGTEYDYLGTAPHPGRCPECGSPCVEPAGELTIRASSCWQSAIGLSKISVRAVDVQDRPFVCTVAAHKCRGKMVSFTIDEVSVIPYVNDVRDHIPSKITDEIADYGITELEAPFTMS